MRSGRAATLLLALCTMACGGGGDPSVPDIGVVPTPTPSPSPSPSPSPTVYVLPFAEDHGFSGLGVTLTTIAADSATSTARSNTLALLSDPSLVRFDYTAANQTYDVRFGTDRLVTATTRLSSSRSGVSINLHQALPDGAGFTRSNVSGGSRDYVGAIGWLTRSGPSVFDSREVVSRRFIFGPRTLVAELPSTAAQTYSGPPPGAAIAYESTASVTTSPVQAGFDLLDLRVDWAAGTITGTMQVSVEPTSNLPRNRLVRVTGTIDRATGSVSGAIAEVEGTGAGGLRGPFNGAFFGPSAVDLALVTGLSQNDGTAVIASIFAYRPR